MLAIAHTQIVSRAQVDRMSICFLLMRIVNVYTQGKYIQFKKRFSKMLNLTMMKTMLNDAVVAWPETKDFLKKKYDTLVNVFIYIYVFIIQRKCKDFDRIWVNKARNYHESIFFICYQHSQWNKTGPRGKWCCCECSRRIFKQRLNDLLSNIVILNLFSLTILLSHICSFGKWL